jgi:hypothetical protein
MKTKELRSLLCRNSQKVPRRFPVFSNLTFSHGEDAGYGFLRRINVTAGVAPRLRHNGRPMNVNGSTLLDVSAVTALHDHYVRAWHDGPQEILKSSSPVIDVVAEQHLRNFRLWHTEDEARRRDVDDSYIAEQKRKIDRFNQERQDLIEKIDEALIAANPRIAEESSAPMNTEMPGSVVDRLSIASLKIFHMREQTERTDVDEAHREKCRQKLSTLERQRRDLAGALELLLADLTAGRRRMQVYRQFKMYNDPNLNPAVYGKK